MSQTCITSGNGQTAGTMNLVSYYIWKWADNDVPGKPNEVFAELMRGQMHPAIRQFDPTELLQVLEQAATAARKNGEEWTWSPQIDLSTKLARFVTATAPEFPWEIPHTPLTDSVWRLGFVCYQEDAGRVGLGLPKHSCMKYTDLPWVYEIEETELPGLLREIPVGTENPFAILEDNRYWFVQTFTDGKHWLVEWRENYSCKDWKQYDQWSAGHWPVSMKKTRVKALNGNDKFGRTSELLKFAEVLDIFRAFLRGEPKPARYHWRSIKDEINER